MTISHYETSCREVGNGSARKIWLALQEAGVEFTEREGVRLSVAYLANERRIARLAVRHGLADEPPGPCPKP